MGIGKPSSLALHNRAHRTNNGKVFATENAALVVLSKRLQEQAEILFNEFSNRGIAIPEKIGAPMDSFEMLNDLEFMSQCSRLSLTTEELKLLSENEQYTKTRGDRGVESVPPKKRYLFLAMLVLLIVLFSVSMLAGVIVTMSIVAATAQAVIATKMREGSASNQESCCIPTIHQPVVKPSEMINRRLELCRLLRSLNFKSGESKRCFKTVCESSKARIAAFQAGLAQCMEAEELFHKNSLKLKISDDIMAQDPYGAADKINKFEDRQLSARMKIVSKITSALLPEEMIEIGVSPSVEECTAEQAEQLIKMSGTKLSIMTKMSDQLSDSLSVVHKNCRMKSRDKIITKSRSKRIMDVLGMRLVVHSSRFTSILLALMSAWGDARTSLGEEVLYTRLKVNYSTKSSWADMKVNFVLRCGARLELQVTPVSNFMVDLDVDGHSKHDSTYI
jgi:hypothetical protein